MNSTSNKTTSQTEQRTAALGTTRRAVLAAGGAVALSGLAGCSALDGLIDRGVEQVVGTTVSAPAAFYPGRPPTTASTSSTSTQERDESQFFRTGPSEVRQVPATVRAESREIDLEGWSISGPNKAKDLNSSRSNKPSTEWWAGPDGDSDGDGYGDVLTAIQDAELELLGHVMAAQRGVEQRNQDEATAGLDAFIDATTETLRPELERCDTGVCETIRKTSEIREQGVRAARDAVADGDWTVAVRELAGVEEIVLRDIERLDDELEDSRPERPRFSDLIEYLRDEPTIGERFTVCLPDAKLPGDRGSLAEELTPGRVLSYFAASKKKEEGGRHTPFHNKYRPQGISYDDDGCVQLDGPVSLHEDISCQNILSAELDTYTTANRGIIGSSTDGGTVVSGIVPVAMDKGLRLAFVAGDGTLREPDTLDSWGPERGAGAVSVTQTLVCPVTVTPADCSCPLPGLFYVRRCTHDDQVIYAGGWLLDEGTLFENSATLLFDEGPTEIASVTKEDVESDDYEDRIVGQFARDRSRYGSMVISDDIDDADSIPEALMAAAGGKKGYDYFSPKMTDPDSDDDGLSDGEGISVSVTALDAPLIHLDGRGEEVDILGMGAEKLT